MFPLEQGAFEMLLIGAIALIVVGPKDLPVLMRKVGQFTAKMRGLASEFRASFDEMARQSELDELRKEVEAMRTGQYTAPISAEIDKQLYNYDQTPAAYPSPPETSEISPTASLEAPPPTLGEDEVLAATIKKPRVRKAVATADASAATPKPRKPRSKSAPVGDAGA